MSLDAYRPFCYVHFHAGCPWCSEYGFRRPSRSEWEAIAAAAPLSEEERSFVGRYRRAHHEYSRAREYYRAGSLPRGERDWNDGQARGRSRSRSPAHRGARRGGRSSSRSRISRSPLRTPSPRRDFLEQRAAGLPRIIRGGIAQPADEVLAMGRGGVATTIIATGAGVTVSHDMIDNPALVTSAIAERKRTVTTEVGGRRRTRR